MSLKLKQMLINGDGKFSGNYSAECIDAIFECAICDDLSDLEYIHLDALEQIVSKSLMYENVTNSSGQPLNTVENKEELECLLQRIRDKINEEK